MFSDSSTVRPRGRTNLQYTSKHRLWSPKVSLTGIIPVTLSERKDFSMSKNEIRKRNNRVQVRLDNKEHQAFLKAVKRSRLSQEVYLRHLIIGVAPQDAPPPDYYAMMQQLYRIGNNLNQIAQKAHTLNVIDVQRYDAAVSQFEAAVKEITAAVLQPRPMKQ